MDPLKEGDIMEIIWVIMKKELIIIQIGLMIIIYKWIYLIEMEWFMEIFITDHLGEG